MNLFKYSVWIVFALLFIANVFVFVYGVNLGSQISHYESEIKKLRQENVMLEKKAFAASSLTNAAFMAAKLDFTKKSAPMYMDSIKVALNR